MLLEAAADDFEDPDNVRKLLRGLREVRMAKLRQDVEVLDAGGGVKMNGVGGMEVAEGRAFVTGVIDGLRLAELAYLCDVRFLPCYGPCTDFSIGKSQPHASSKRKTETGKEEKMDTQGRWTTMMTMKWICNETRTILSYESESRWIHLLANIASPKTIILYQLNPLSCQYKADT
jgi:hypothetical protein